MASSCPFCPPPEDRLVDQNQLAIAFFDRFPVSDGHVLVVPKRHVASWFDATAEERAACLELVDRAKARLDETNRPDGYNLGINVGSAAGQTVFHLHLHVIPRYAGDVPDPRGGVRFVIPDKANYLRHNE